MENFTLYNSNDVPQFVIDFSFLKLVMYYVSYYIFFSFLYNQINELFNGAISKHFKSQMIVFLICVINEFQVFS